MARAILFGTAGEAPAVGNFFRHAQGVAVRTGYHLIDARGRRMLVDCQPVEWTRFDC